MCRCAALCLPCLGESSVPASGTGFPPPLGSDFHVTCQIVVLCHNLGVNVCASVLFIADIRAQSFDVVHSEASCSAFILSVQ